jgi:hypothetical protein
MIGIAPQTFVRLETASDNDRDGADRDAPWNGADCAPLPRHRLGLISFASRRFRHDCVNERSGDSGITHALSDLGNLARILRGIFLYQLCDRRRYVCQFFHQPIVMVGGTLSTDRGSVTIIREFPPLRSLILVGARFALHPSA